LLHLIDTSAEGWRIWRVVRRDVEEAAATPEVARRQDSGTLLGGSRLQAAVGHPLELRPRQEGTAGCASGGDLHGFRRRVETVSCLVPTWILKKRNDLSRTRYCPSYIGDSGGWAPSRRTRNKQVSSNSSGRLSGPGRLW
jgi:hypothetical protein